MPGTSARRPFLPVLLVLTAILLAGCSRPPELIGVANPSVAVDAVPDVTRHRIFIASTRTPSAEPGVFLSTGRAAELGLASVEVTIPPTHVIGQIERPRRLPPDPRTEFTVVDPVVHGGDADMISALNRELASRPRGERKLLLFVHGYNNTASDAVLRLAQFVEDTGFQGVPTLLTWASAASTPRYVHDSTARSSPGARSRRWPTSWPGPGQRVRTSSPTRWAPC
ncbi:alpha/beta hydrolase [Rhodovulum tesquicola]|uniref:alpha/beta hydrolase n=1 Tax=Rhodovulum tesquicola TaxID=540254 RepID=UPI0020973C87|nr:alpha/beta hydrolase [Rhodovulum tesquicola]MCO8146125.1 alpha/beta hydrolase [Rhodovulum tesquicola]